MSFKGIVMGTAKKYDLSLPVKHDVIAVLDTAIFIDLSGNNKIIGSSPIMTGPGALQTYSD